MVESTRKGLGTMGKIRLSRQAEELLTALYRKYRSRIDANVDPFVAAVFGTASDIQRDALPNWAVSDIEASCYELEKAELLDCLCGDDTIQTAILNQNGINYAADRFRRNLSKFLNFAERALKFWP